MKANISEELEILIDEKIYLDLEVHILTNKLNSATEKNEEQLILFYEKMLNNKLSDLKKVNEQLRKENIKFQEPIDDGIFVQYDFYIKTNGGYKEGNFRYWKDAIKNKLNKRLNNK